MEERQKEIRILLDDEIHTQFKELVSREKTNMTAAVRRFIEQAIAVGTVHILRTDTPATEM